MKEIKNETKFSKLKIQFNEQDKCPVCGNEKLDIYDAEDAEECGFIEKWQCNNCKCTGQQYFQFTDHYDVYAEDGETRIDSENQDNFPYLKRTRLIELLKNALFTIHEVTGEDDGYDKLYDLQNDIGITYEEYAAITGITDRDDGEDEDEEDDEDDN